MKRTISGLLTATLIVVMGCGRRQPQHDPPPIAVEGKELAKNPAAAAQQLQAALQEQADIFKEMENTKPVDPVHFEKLIPLLPDMIDGYTAEKATGSTIGGEGFKLTQVERDYRGEDKQIRIQIIDSGFHPTQFAGIKMASKFSTETTEGYDKGVTVDGDPGIEHFRKSDKDARLEVIVGKRYLVSISGRPLEAASLRTILGKIDRKKLADLK